MLVLLAPVQSNKSPTAICFSALVTGKIQYAFVPGTPTQRGRGDPIFFKIQIKRKLKRKRKQKRKQGSLREGREAPPRRCPPLLRFCFRFRFNSRSI